MDKVRVEDFDPDVCLGDHPAVDGPCPHLVPSDADTGRKVIDTARKVEMAVLGTITEPREGACGMCSCPLVNLGALSFVPVECPRIELHGGEA